MKDGTWSENRTINVKENKILLYIKEKEMIKLKF